MIDLGDGKKLPSDKYLSCQLIAKFSLAYVKQTKTR